MQPHRLVSSDLGIQRSEWGIQTAEAAQQVGCVASSNTELRAVDTAEKGTTAAPPPKHRRSRSQLISTVPGMHNAFLALFSTPAAAIPGQPAQLDPL